MSPKIKKDPPGKVRRDIVDVLSVLYTSYPSLRIGQIIANAISSSPTNLFYISDEEFHLLFFFGV